MVESWSRSREPSPPPPPKTDDSIAVAFCCLGNICRSPMAEAIMRQRTKEMMLDTKITLIDSFGTSGFNAGDNPDRRTVQTCKANGVPIAHTSRQISKSDFHKFDYIFAMDRDNLEDLNYMRPRGIRAKIELFGTYCENPKLDRIVSDPYYGGPDGFQKSFKQLDHFTRVFLKTIEKGAGGE
ncbi:low molecular weight phosphotyrosine protein phosphatase [Myxozyma melibiosi]|uniref:Low molecular weight phosphotyrosine protein phosphatase n=1 Tax=Myxozyma melibiosi TaxID=54550 RepID=A0ABR1EYY0_9ASCO